MSKKYWVYLADNEDINEADVVYDTTTVVESDGDIIGKTLHAFITCTDSPYDLAEGLSRSMEYADRKEFEYAEIDIRCFKLRRMINNYELNDLEPIDYPLSILKARLATMEAYRELLWEQMEQEGFFEETLGEKLLKSVEEALEDIRL